MEDITIRNFFPGGNPSPYAVPMTETHKCSSTILLVEALEDVLEIETPVWRYCTVLQYSTYTVCSGQSGGQRNMKEANLNIITNDGNMDSIDEVNLQ